MQYLSATERITSIEYGYIQVHFRNRNGNDGCYCVYYHFYTIRFLLKISVFIGYQVA